MEFTWEIFKSLDMVSINGGDGRRLSVFDYLRWKKQDKASNYIRKHWTCSRKIQDI
uniref:Uncharacterized protein n=1 Tax=Arundo donax TaxID=35708 RepID=A0A0A9EP47_ARUDO